MKKIETLKKEIKNFLKEMEERNWKKLINFLSNVKTTKKKILNR